MAARASIARPARWHGTGEVDPRFYFTFENFTFTGDAMTEIRQRPKIAQGAVWWEAPGDRDDLLTLSDIRQDLSTSSRHPVFSVAGHLIAKMMTGVDEPENLVPVTKSTNDRMQKVENEIKKLAAYPHWLKVEVLDYYDEPDKDPRVPRSFRYTLYEGGMPPTTTTKIVREWPIVTQAWLHVGAFDYDASEVALVQKMKIGMKLGWKIEDCTAAGPGRKNLTWLKGSLPPVDRRPLSFLDYWLIGYQGLGRYDESQIREYVDSIEAGASYSLKWVRDLAIKGNVLANNNWLISDVYGRQDSIIDAGDAGAVVEGFQGLIIGSGANAPHVDHIWPESLGGSNCFSNAQITSMTYNVQKGNNTKYLQVRSPEWKSEMSKKVANDPMVKFHTGGPSVFGKPMK